MRFETLLIPTDGSETAERAAQRGFKIAKQLDADIHVLSVADSSLAAGAGYSGDSPRIRQRLRTLASERSEQIRREASRRGLTVTSAVSEGIPAQEIVEYATDHDIDGIVLGTSGRGGVPRAVIGSVADKVIRTASVPVFTLNRKALDSENATEDLGSILIPTDGSTLAERAAMRGIKIAEQLEAQIHVINVVESEGTLDDEDGMKTDETAGDTVEPIVEACRDRGLDIVTSIRSGKPAEEIVAYVRENEIGGIAIGTQGRGGFQRWLLGSVTDTVVRTAPVPVITIRPSPMSSNE